MTEFELTLVNAIAVGDTEAQEAILVHEVKDEFHDGDCILFGYSVSELETDEDVAEALNNNTPETCFHIDEETGVYVVE